MELRFGDSDQWKWPQEAIDFEEKVYEFFRPRHEVAYQSDFLQAEITQRWIDWAAQNGDMTYLQYKDGPLIPPYVRYDGSVHNPKDFMVPEIDIDRYGKVDYPDEETLRELQEATPRIPGREEGRITLV